MNGPAAPPPAMPSGLARAMLHAAVGFAGVATALALAAAAALCLPIPAAAAEPSVISSPDGRLRVEVRWPEAGSAERPAWSLAFGGRTRLSSCRLGLEIAGGGELLAGAAVRDARSRSVDDRVRMRFGKASHGADRFHETRFSLAAAGGRGVGVTFRCYDDAVAFRYELGSESPGASIAITDETTSFQAEGNPLAHAQYLEHHHTSHEHPVVTVRHGELLSGALIDLPLTLAWDDGACVAITEAALRRYAGMSLQRPLSPAPRLDLICRLTPGPDGVKVRRPLPLVTPWRVVLAADRPGALLESTTIFCLNDPEAIQDADWIRPGKLTFSWWNGDVYDGKPGPPILSLEMATRYIDFCAQNGIPTHALTSTEGVMFPWYRQSSPGPAPGPDTDVTLPRPGFDLEAIRRHADSRGVKLWTWVHHAALHGRVGEAFAAFERQGWSGMMVDFIDHDGQESVEFVESVLEAAARHRILIHLHGIWKPTGLERTYPNLVNHEGALNLEYLKWSDRCTPEHTLGLVFTRLVAGPMDYHLGGFRAVPRSKFEPRKVAPEVLGTRCHQLAMYVCFDNPMPMVADYPTAYVGQPGFDFIQAVPTWWDETRVVAARIGELVVTARRKDRTWYLGALSAKQARDVVVPLDFLGPRRHLLTLWRDAPDSALDPNRLAMETRQVSAGDSLTVPIALDGGFVARLAPLAE